MKHYKVRAGATRVCLPAMDKTRVEYHTLDDVWADWVEVEPGLYELVPRDRILWGYREIELHPIGPYLMAYDAETDTLFCGRAA